MSKVSHVLHVMHSRCLAWCYCFWFQLMNEFKWAPQYFCVDFSFCILLFVLLFPSLFLFGVYSSCLVLLTFVCFFCVCVYVRVFSFWMWCGLMLLGLCLWYHWLSLVFINKHFSSYMCHINKVLIIPSNMKNEVKTYAPKGVMWKLPSPNHIWNETKWFSNECCTSAASVNHTYPFEFSFVDGFARQKKSEILSAKHEHYK